MSLVAIDVRSLEEAAPTGVGEYGLGLLEALFSVDQSNEYVLYSNSARADSHFHGNDRWAKQSVRTHYPNKLLNAGISFFRAPALDRLIEAKCGRRPDIFFAPNWNFIALTPECKFVLAVHDFSHEIVPWSLSRIERLWHRAIHPRELVRRADAIVVPSENTMRDISDLCRADPQKITVLPPGAACPLPTEEDKARVRARYALPEKYILFLGTVEPRKNIAGLIDAFGMSELRRHGYSLLIAGKPGRSASAHRMLVGRAGPSVRFLGYIAGEDKGAMYAQAKCFAYPSLYEGFGLPVIEAMSLGIPVITSNRSSLAEVACGAGMLVNPLDIAQMAGAMRRMCEDGALHNECALAGRPQARKFSFEQSAKMLMELFVSLGR